VLIVDDEDDSRYLLRVVLESCAMEVCDCENVDGALAELEHTHFDLIVSDIAMPGCDGYSLIRAVRTRRDLARIPAIALTAFVRPEDRARTRLAGFDQHIGKPFDSGALIQAVVALIGDARRPG
jgi:CheY-like chemotaxis protein